MLALTKPRSHAAILASTLMLVALLSRQALHSTPRVAHADGYAPDFRRFDLEAHMAWRRRCDWIKLEQLGGPVDGFTTLSLDVRHSEPIDAFLDHQYEAFNRSRPYVLQHGPWRCTQPVMGDSESFAFVERFGPYTTRGGEDWVSAWFSDVGGLSELPSDAPLYMTSGAFMPMTNFHTKGEPEFYPKGDDVPVPHPPINPHHWHMNTGPNWDFRNEADQYVLYQVHSDNSQCAGREGLDCYGFDLPEGFGLSVLKDNHGKNMLFFTGSWLDVRAPNSPAMHHWLEFSATITTRRPRLTVDTFAMIGIPFPMGLQLTRPREEYLSYRNDTNWVEHFNEMLFTVPRSGGSVFWSSISGPPVTASGSQCVTINSWRWHQHGRFMLTGMWLMRGSSTELGLPELLGAQEVHVEVYTDMFLTGPPGQAIPTARRNLTIPEVQKRLKATRGFICEFPLDHPDKWEMVQKDDFWPGVNGHEYPRHVHQTCPSVTLYPGDALTLISFYDPPDSPLIDVPLSGIMTGQHGMLEAFQFNGDCDQEILAEKLRHRVENQNQHEWFHDW